jgi:hypothetical protein
MVLQLNALVHRDIVLDSDSVSYPDVRADVDILSQRTIPTQGSPFLDMAEMPNLGTIPDGYPFIDETALVNEIIFHPFPSGIMNLTLFSVSQR